MTVNNAGRCQTVSMSQAKKIHIIRRWTKIKYNLLFSLFFNPEDQTLNYLSGAQCTLINMLNESWPIQKQLAICGIVITLL